MRIAVRIRESSNLTREKMTAILKAMKINTDKYRIEEKDNRNLKDYPSRYEGDLDRIEAKAGFAEITGELRELQGRLYAEGKQSLLVVLQAMDAGGKDSTTRSVFGPLNPQGVKVTSFKAPTDLERAHDFLWRVHAAAPAKGFISVFNRSHYEDVLIVKIKKWALKKTIEKRYNHINNFESLLIDSGTKVLKFYLHISKEYQKEQFTDRLEDPAKHWKYNPADVTERAFWDDYMEAFEDVFRYCSKKEAHWYIIPAERKWYRNLLIGTIVRDTLRKMDPKYPEPEFDPSKESIPD